MELSAKEDMQRVLLFDYDGVIADSFSLWYRIYKRLAPEMGMPLPRSEEDLLRLYDKNIFASLRLVLGSRMNPRAIQERIREESISLYPREVPVFNGMKSLIITLGKKHPLFIIPSNASLVVQEHLAHHRITGVRSVMGPEKESDKSKKIQTIQSQFSGAEFWYIGDTVGDIKEGQNAGVKTVAVTWGYHAKERLAAVKPDYLVSTPRELLALLK